MRHSTPGISVNARKKELLKIIELENFNSNETIFFDLFKFNISFKPQRGPIPKKMFKKIILEGRGFRGGSDEKIRRMWLRLGIVVAGLPLPPLHFFGTVCKLNLPPLYVSVQSV